MRQRCSQRLGKAHRAKRNRHQHDVAAGGELRVRVPHGFERRVVTAARDLGPAAVPLHAERARPEAIAGALVVERVDQQPDAVVVLDVLARREIRAHARGVVVEREEHGVEVPRVVAEIDVGALARRRAVLRHALREAVTVA